MNKITQGIGFQAFGYKIKSDFYLPELNKIENYNGAADIFVEMADLTGVWKNSDVNNRKFLIGKDFFLFKVTDTAIFLVENGTTIKVSPLAGSSMDKIRLFILGTCMGAILLQRKILPLHGSAIAINGKAYAFVGDSGAGKSTLASGLMSKGYPLLSDDVIAVSFSKDHIPYVTPSYPQQKLWCESLDYLGMDHGLFQPLFEREEKFAIPAATNFYAQKLPLAGIFELVKADTGEVKISNLQNLKKVHTLFQHTYRNLLISKMDLIEWHFKLITRLTSLINVYQINRPKTQFTLPQLETLVLTTLKED